MKKNFILLFLLFFVTIPTWTFSKVHFSIDDVSRSLYDLTKNQERYVSAFEQPFFKYLKDLNNKYGVIISLYCFYEQNGFTLANCTDKFSKDFDENSSWLKFGYHAWSPTITFIGGGMKCS